MEVWRDILDLLSLRHGIDILVVMPGSGSLEPGAGEEGCAEMHSLEQMADSGYLGL